MVSRIRTGSSRLGAGGRAVTASRAPETEVSERRQAAARSITSSASESDAGRSSRSTRAQAASGRGRASAAIDEATAG